MKLYYLLKPLLVFNLLFSTMPSHAAQKWSSNRKITAIYPTASSFVFYLGGLAISAAGCELNRFALPVTSANYDAKISVLITAFAGQKNVRVNYDDSTVPSCQIVANRMIVST
ncbi:MAG: hypothetical protein ABJN65_01010 [Parasphingorhabdus sp.]